MRDKLIRILQAVVLLAVVSSFAHAGAGDLLYIKKKAAETSCSYTPKDNNVTGANNGLVGSSSGQIYASNSFVSGLAYTLKKLALNLKITGDPISGGLTTITISLCADSSGAPGACTAIGTQAVSGLTTSYVEHEYVYAPGYSIANAASYWISVHGNTYVDASNYVSFARNGTGAAGALYISGNGSSWSLSDGTSDIVFKTYSCE